LRHIGNTIAQEGKTMPEGMLSGIRVLDLSLLLPGPYCTLLMADYGADVIKVDDPNPRGRLTFGGFAASVPGMGPAERYLNRGKRSLTLDLKTEEGRGIFRALADKADVVVEGFRPGVAARLGVDHETLSARNPRLVYCSISGFGQTGPMRTAAGHDINYIACAGILGLCGRRGAPPAIPPVQIGDLFGGGMTALAGILMALVARQATGLGRHIDVAMTDGALAMLAVHAADLLAGGPSPERGNMPLSGTFPCYETYRCADGEYVSIGALESVFWERLVKALGREDLLHVQYAEGDEADRAKAALGEVFGTRTRDEWTLFFKDLDVCFSPVLSLPEVLDHPNTKARGMVVEVESPLGGEDRQIGLPFRTSGGEESPRRPPRIGEHDGAILSEILGYGPDRIAALREKGVIRR
jgi:crotonobetainyl-CoA:carnitine CoA-transferase CaiB-like acyl-CoA transferase